MREVHKIEFEAFDGTPHPTVEACRAYEKVNILRRFVGLTLEQVEAAFARDDPGKFDAELADAFEVVGAKLARLRIADGERKRERRAAVPEPERLAITGPRSDDAKIAPDERPETNNEAEAA